MRASLYDMDPGPNCPEIVRMVVEIPNMVDNEEADQKIVAVPNRIPRYDEVRTWTRSYLDREAAHVAEPS